MSWVAELKAISHKIARENLKKSEPGKCILTGKPSEKRVIFARAY